MLAGNINGDKKKRKKEQKKEEKKGEVMEKGLISVCTTAITVISNRFCILKSFIFKESI